MNKGLNIIKKTIHRPDTKDEFIEYEAIYLQVEYTCNIVFNNRNEVRKIVLVCGIDTSILTNAMCAIDIFLKENK